MLAGLHTRTPVLAGIDGPVMVDIDDSIIEVHRPAKQGAGFGYTRMRGLNSAITTLTCGPGVPVIAAQRLRKGACNSARGAHRLIADTLPTLARLRSEDASGPGSVAGGFSVLRSSHGHHRDLGRRPGVGDRPPVCARTRGDRADQR
jgi:hypothetical protein